MVTQHAVLAPIPNYSDLRRNKPGYDTRFVVDPEHPLHNDPLVDVREWNVFADASSYYAKPRTSTGGLKVPDAPLLRLDIVRRLLRAECYLRNSADVREALGTPAHFRIDDALRPLIVQQHAFFIAWPEAIAKKHPELSRQQVLDLVPDYCADPSNSTPTPHLTGGAVDGRLCSLETGEPFDRGHQGGRVTGTAFPDFHEGYHLLPGASDIVDSPEQAEVAPEDSQVRLVRRIQHYALTVIAGLFMNPNEIWHAGLGDPLSAYVAGDGRQPYYGIAVPPQWYVDELTAMQRA